MQETSAETQIAQMFEGVAHDVGGEFRTVLDFGCGAGRLVEAFDRRGITAYGCDIRSYLADDLTVQADRFAQLSFDPYRLPYDDDTFDAVVSTSVLEHAQNTAELFAEIRRILKPGGWSLHLLPGKWYLPREPHIFVPLVSWLWPRVPYWWLRLWAALGTRNAFQTGLSAKETADRNAVYCREGLIYLSTSTYERLSREIFGNCQWLMPNFLRRADGGAARLWRASPFKAPIELISRECRMGLIAQQKHE